MVSVVAVVAAGVDLFVIVVIVEAMVVVAIVGVLSLVVVVVVVVDDLVFTASVVFISESDVFSDESIMLEIVENRSKAFVCDSIILSLSSSSKSVRR